MLSRLEAVSTALMVQPKAYTIALAIATKLGLSAGRITVAYILAGVTHSEAKSKEEDSGAGQHEGEMDANLEPVL